MSTDILRRLTDCRFIIIYESEKLKTSDQGLSRGPRWGHRVPG